MDKVEDQDGLALVLTAILIGLICLVLAFSIDIGRFSISQAEHKQAAAAAGLTALSSYWQQVNSSERTELLGLSRALRHARAEAVKVLRNAQVLPVFSTIPEETKIDINNYFNYVPEPDVSGVLRYGFWHFQPPVGGCSGGGFDRTCPCQSGKWKGACFERMPPNRSSEPVSAIQVEIFTPLRSPFRWAFASGAQVLPRGVRARATVSLASDPGASTVPRVVENISLPPYPETESAQVSKPELIYGGDDESQDVFVPPSEIPRRPKPAVLVQAEEPSEEKEDLCEHGSRRWKNAGVYSLSLPEHCYEIRILAWGAGGAGEQSFVGAGGGFSTGAIEVQSTDVLRLVVGSGGFATCAGETPPGERFGGPGLANGTIGWGGGFTGVFINDAPIIFAGGGGAAGTPAKGYECEVAGIGGPGGGQQGQSGEAGMCQGSPAGGASQTLGGLGARKNEALNGKAYHGGFGGGGGGVFGGGGTSLDAGGAGGGAGFLSQLLGAASSEVGEREMPPRTEDENYLAPAGQGGRAGCDIASAHGSDGLLVIAW